jgi:hypothetical protein
VGEQHEFKGKRKMETHFNGWEDVSVVAEVQTPSSIGRWTAGSPGSASLRDERSTEDARRAGEEFDYACWRATGRMPHLAAATNLDVVSSELRYLTPTLLQSAELAKPLLAARGSHSYVPLSVSHVGRRHACHWASQAGWVELDYNSLVQLTSGKGNVVQRMCRFWNRANRGLVVLDSPLGALAYANGIWAHSRPFELPVNTHRPTFAAHFLVELSTGASLSEALQHGHAAGIAHHMGVSSRTPTDLRAWAATAPRCFPQPPKSTQRWFRHWAERGSELALAASFGGFVAWLAERCYEP